MTRKEARKVLEELNKRQGLIEAIKEKERRGQKYECKQCDKAFPSINELRVHFREHVNEELFPCVICNKFFKKLYQLNAHNRQLHHEIVRQGGTASKPLSDAAKIPPKLIVPITKRLPNGDIIYECGKCDKEFSDRAELIKHRWTHKRKPRFTCFICKDPTVSYSTIELKEHYFLEHENEKYHCDECKRVFHHPMSLSLHYRQMHSNCNVGFNNSKYPRSGNISKILNLQKK